MINKTIKQLLTRLMPWLMMAAMGLVGCEEKLYLGIVDCGECYQEKPEECKLSIDITLLSSGRGIPIAIYRGNVEDGSIERIDTAYWTPYEHWVSVDRKYSVRAEYFVNNATVYVVDGTRPEIRRVPDDCDEECYVVVKATMDARLDDRFP